MHLNNKIGRKARGGEKDKRFSYLQFGDVNFYKYLLMIGYVPRKSLTLGPIVIEDNFFIDFLRGVIDGDGNISTWIHRTNYNRQWSLRIYSASPIFMKWLNDKIEKEFSIRGKFYARKLKNRDNPIYHLQFGKMDAARILDEIYYTGCLSLKRKLIQAQLCLQQSRKVVNYAR